MKKPIGILVLLISGLAASSGFASEPKDLGLDSLDLAEVMIQNAEIVQSFRELGTSIVAASVEEIDPKTDLYVIDALRKQGDSVYGQAQLRIKRVKHDANADLAYSTYEAEIITQRLKN